MKSVLIVNLARFGDLVQMIPMLQSLHSAHPEAEFALLADHRCASVCRMLPFVSAVHALDMAELLRRMHAGHEGIEEAYAYLSSFFEMLRSHQYERIINITPHYIGVLAAYVSHPAAPAARAACAWDAYYHAVTRSWNALPMHLSDLFTGIAGVPRASLAPALSLSHADHREAQALLNCFSQHAAGPVIAVHAGGSTHEKRWPENNFAEVCLRLIESADARVVFVGRGSNPEPARACKDRYPDRVLDCTNHTSPAVLGAVLSRMSLLITGDSGPMHAGAAAGTRVLSLHTAKETCFTTGPYGESHIAIEPAIECHPCERPEKCFNRRCQACITPDIVWRIARGMLEGSDQERAALRADRHTAHVYVSGFDAGGWMEYRPAQSQPLHLPRMARRLLRAMWSLDLDGGQTRCAAGSADAVRQAARQAAQDLRSCYALGSQAELAVSWHAIDTEIDRLSRQAERGCAMALAMAQTGQLPAAEELAELKVTAAAIESLDRHIISAGEALGPFVQLTRLFAVEMEALDGWDLQAMALETARIFGNLKRRSSLMQALGNACMEQLFSPAARASEYALPATGRQRRTEQGISPLRRSPDVASAAGYGP